MKVSKAIKVLTDFREQESELLGNEFKEATSLGIEALKRCMLLRAMAAFESKDLLPGETEK